MALNPAFKKDLQSLINRHSVDAELEIPDYILANYICVSLLTLQSMRNDEIAHALSKISSDRYQEIIKEESKPHDTH